MTISILIIGLFIGGASGYFGRKYATKDKIASAEKHADELLQSAKQEKSELILAAKEEALKLKEAAKEVESETRNELKEMERTLRSREERFAAQLLELQKKQDTIDKTAREAEALRLTLKEERDEIRITLEMVAGLSTEEALKSLEDTVEQEYQEALLSRVKKLERQNEEAVEAEARKILALAMQRFASSQSVDHSTTMVELPSDDMKGRIIGKEGRNIKALERLTGCELIVDDTPGMIMVSGFSPVRRQVARLAIEDLVKDGRIQPARIEAAIEKAKKDLAKDMRKAGEEALMELGIPVSSIDPKLISILGRLKFRTSYGQNVLQHSIEVARISGMIAAEIGADVFNCKKGGLFHDIGKAVDHDMQGAHPEIGYNIMKKFGFPEELCYQSIAHHEDKPRTLEGTIVKAADAISGARPGARRNSIEEYIQRLENLEKTANEFEGVEKAYAIQAGREVRVFVHPQKVDDYGAHKLANMIAKKIENDLTYPGEVKVTIIRETRISEFAR
ncbi:MAG: ribonuclease Y [bacterium]|nr:ribonuclease Y [bacterium]MDA1024475.1 ribonuclease Y [bacterium]